MSGTLYFAVGTIGLSKREGRKPSTLLQAARHNRRQIQAELGAYSHIDAARTCQNETISGADNPDAVVALAHSLMAEAGVDVGKLRKDYCQAIELLFSLAPDTPINTGHYFKSCLAWAVGCFGSGNVLSADIHRDESAPHCHILILPLSSGRHVGSALIGRAELKKLRASFAKKVGEPFGLKTPPRRLSAAMRTQTIGLVLQWLETRKDPILQSALWQTVRRNIESDPTSFAQALGIELGTAPPRPSKTMAQIFTSKGKGGKTERICKPIGFDTTPKAITKPEHKPSQLNPIGFQKDDQNHRNLSCVGFEFKHQLEATTMETTRVHDRDLDPATGEYLLPLPAPSRHQRTAAAVWVVGALSKIHPQHIGVEND
jgi:hypothetical protein